MKYNWHICAMVLIAVCAFLYGLNFSTPVSLKLVSRIGSEGVSFLGALVGAGATVFAAVFAARYQFDKAKQAAEIQKQRELAAARALLTSDLSALVEYLENCVDVSLLILNGSVVAGPPSLRPIPNDPLLRIAKLISLEPSGNPNVLPKLLEHLQIHHARLSSRVNDYRTQSQGISGRRNRSFDAVFSVTVAIYLQVSNLFPFSRREVNEIVEVKFVEADFQSAIHLLGLLPIFSAEELDRIRPSTQRLIEAGGLVR